MAMVLLGQKETWDRGKTLQHLCSLMPVKGFDVLSSYSAAACLSQDR